MIRILFLCLNLIILTNLCVGQYRLVSNFTNKEGLPSNCAYRCIEDEKGFLWIATDQGIARFDGSRFQTFSTLQGLSDNDALIPLRENNGRIWVKGSNGEVSYFDAKQNKFINSKQDKNLQQLKKKFLTRPFTLTEGGVYFPSVDTSYRFLNSIWSAFPEIYKNKKSFICAFNHDGSDIRFAIDTSLQGSFYLSHTNNQRVVESISLQPKNKDDRYYVDEQKILLVNKNSNQVILFSEFKTAPLKCRRDTIRLINNYYWHNFTNKYLVFIFENGLIHLYNKRTLAFVDSIRCNYLPNGVLDDKQGNIWVGTYFKGLFLYQNRSILDYPLASPYVNKSIQSIVRKKDGSLLLGNSSGEIIEHGLEKNVLHKKPNAKNTDIERHIILSQNKIFTFGEGGIFVNYTKPLQKEVNACKTAHVLNDSIILCGFNNGISILNTIYETITEINNLNIQVTSIAHINQTEFYIGSTDGLYLYRFQDQKIVELKSLYPKLNERIASITCAEDSLVWVATATQGIVVLKNNQVVKNLSEQIKLPSDNCLTIATGRKNQIWVATNLGISIIQYSNQNHQIQNLSESDGLNSNFVNQFYFYQDTMYAATENGISSIPANISIPKFDIGIELTGIKINTHDTIINQLYHLKFNQNNILLQFAGIELTGHFKNAQYSINTGKTWIDIDGRSLNLQLSSGEHDIWLRAIDVNGHTGSKVLKIKFDIAFPYYKTWWFWLMIAAVLFGLSVYLNRLIVKQKHRREIERFLNKQMLDEFEIQALKAQINPHFVFNCLNSIKGFIYEKDFEKADLYLQKFSNLLRNTLNYSSKPSISLKSELEYVDTYLTMEKLRFGNKFIYQIKCDHSIQQDDISIPAMLLQPFVENAIKHGVCKLINNSGLITITISQENEYLNISIDDNGVGRNNKANTDSLQNQTHESKGTQLTQRRIEIYQIGLEIIDKTDPQGLATGTKINLRIPIPLK